MALSFALLRSQLILACVIVLLLSLLHPSVAFGVTGRAKQARTDQAVGSPLFRNDIMAKQRKSPPASRLVPFATALSSTAAADEPAKEDGQVEEEKVTWKDRLLKVSNIASILCVIDCTVLPIVTVVMPLLGLAAFTPAQMEWLHSFGHQVAMYFVIPVGGTAAALNYSTHKKWKLSAPALLGLLLIYLANGHGGPILGMLPHDVAHQLHCGTILHRATNVAGCALLLGSNYKSHQATHEHGGDCCHHDH